ncbi:MAG: hypothetical protein EYC62_00170 [Alphaproteobacteria bacterium]|nr:MAG: hypothetical protein EYC62_00170 [Alphaproteobacteria bacterium]
MSFDRYQRQIILSELKPEGQAQLERSSVLCIGAGGLGSPALLYLAAAGVGKIGICDFDRVELHNLQRQILFSQHELGTSKAVTATEKLARLNKDIVIVPHEEKLTPENAERLFNQYDVIVDGSDNFDTKFLAADAAYKCGKPLVYASILGFDGQVAVFDTPATACYRCLYDSAPTAHVPNCGEAGVIGAIAGIMGSIQALEAIKLCLRPVNKMESLAGKLLTIDAKNYAIRTVNIAKDSACPLCSKAPAVVQLKADLAANCSTWNNSILIDVREKDEWAAGHIEGAVNLPLSEIQAGTEWAKKFNKNQEYVLYCQRGRRSKVAMDIFKQQGFEKVSDIPGGYQEFMQIKVAA